MNYFSENLPVDSTLGIIYVVFGANYLSDTRALRDYLLWDTFHSKNAY